MTNQDHYKWLLSELPKLNRRSKLFRLLKDELSALGYWRNKPRGKPNLANFGDKIKRHDVY